MIELSKKILNVDDNEANRYALTRALRKAGFTVSEAVCGKDALKAVDAEPPMVVLLDVNLPDMSGYEVCRRIKSAPETAGIAVMQMSATFVKAEDQVRGLQGGADMYLTEPIEIDVLIATVRAQLRVREAEQERAKAQRAVEVSRQRLQILADATQAISEAQDAKAIEKILPLLVPKIADWVAIEVFDSGLHPYAQASLHHDFHRSQMLQTILVRFPSDARLPHLARVISHGKAELVSPVTDQWLGLYAKNGEHLLLLKSLAQTSRITVPMMVRGKAAGVITAGMCRAKRSFDSEDVRFFEDLAYRMGVAIDNAQLFQQAQRHNRLKDEFLATLAHELRNPLAPIRNAVELMESNQDADPRLLGIIKRQVKNVSRLVDDLTDIARIESGKLALRTQNIDMVELTRTVLQTFMEMIKSRNQTLTVNLPSQPQYAQGDPTRLEQVLANLVHNASKYTPELGHIWVTLETRNDDIFLHVCDNGLGISPEILPRIFDLFAQAPQTLDRPQGGLGIGLTIVRHLVEQHHGSIAARSAGEGKGAEFIVRLPRSPRQEPDIPSESAFSRHTKRKRRIVIIEDNEDSRETLKEVLQLWGHEVWVSEDGVQGVETILAHKPELALVDIGLPGMSGFDVARAIRAKAGDAIRLIALTGYGQEQDRVDAIAAGFNRHIVKPIDLDVLQKVIGG